MSERHHALLVALADAGEVAVIEIQVSSPERDEFRHAQPCRIEHFNERFVAQPACSGGVGLVQQSVDFLEREKLRQSSPCARRSQIVGGTAIAFLLRRGKAIETADARDGAGDRPRCQTRGHQLPHERFEVLALKLADGSASFIGEVSENRQVARIALDRIRRHATDVTQVGEVDVNHGTPCSVLESLITHHSSRIADRRIAES
jgi:hypothetical protein